MRWYVELKFILKVFLNYFCTGLLEHKNSVKLEFSGKIKITSHAKFRNL